MTANIIRISVMDASYPQALRDTPGCPGDLFVRGALPAAPAPIIAVVGTRKATSGGRATAREMARDLVRRGAVVVSGLALGIDASAHEGALDAGGITVAVLANGLDRAYPAQHEQLARRILAAGGCLISEYPPGTPPLPHQFLARNRIVSGLSLGVVIVEAPMRSGSLVTAKFALEQGREVFVVPGPAAHPNFAGSHRLIREGARLVASADDVLDDLGLAPAPESPVETSGLTPAERAIVEYLVREASPRLMDEVAAATGLPGEEVSAALTTLALRDKLVEIGQRFMVR